MKKERTIIELIVWVTGLLVLALSNPYSQGLDLCPFKFMGWSCPGCGLGHSISWLFHGDIRQSLEAHPLGILAVVVLFYRIVTLIKSLYLPYKSTL